MSDHFKALLEDLEVEYPEHTTRNVISSNYGRPMKIELQSGEILSNIWFRWEHQTPTSLQNRALHFNTNGQKFELSFHNIKKISWD